MSNRSAYFARLLTCLGCSLACLLPVAACAQEREEATVNAATAVLNEIMTIPAKRIPASLLADAEGIAIVPGVVKGGFVVGVRHGRGVLMTRNEDGSWKGPAHISLTGGSVGWQVGVQSTDVILVFRTRRSIDGLMRGKFTIGADASVAAGPVGRKAAAATDASLRAEILSYSRSRGLFAGVSLDGTALEIDNTANAAYYRPAVQADGSSTPTVPRSAYHLVNTLLAHNGSSQAAAAVVSGQPAPGPSTVMPAGGPTVAPAEALRGQLAEASTQLQATLDENWRRYLALPTEAYRPGVAANRESLQATLARYDVVANDGRYRALTSRAEFTRTHQLLKRYLAAMKSATKIQLPPPPAYSTFNPNLRLPH